MKKMIILLMVLSFATRLMPANLPPTYTTSRGSGTIMISGSGTYETDLNQELKSSKLALGTDAALFFFPQLAVGAEFGYMKEYEQRSASDGGDPDEGEFINMRVGPRAYFFLGGKNSELTPFVKGGANYLIRKILINGEEEDSNKKEMGLTASAGLLLNLAKNVGLSVEAEYNFEKGTAAEDIDTKQLLIKFSIRSFLGD